MRTPYRYEFCTGAQGGNSSVGRARPCQGRGREFESRFPLQDSNVAFSGSMKNRSTMRRGNSSVGRARPCQGRGREFESRFPLQNSNAVFTAGCTKHLNAGIAQLVEHDLAKVGVASSSLVSRSNFHTHPDSSSLPEEIVHIVSFLHAVVLS